MSLVIHCDQTISIAIKGQPNGSAAFYHAFFEVLSILRPTIVVDVDSVRFIVNDLNIGAQFNECLRGHFICGPVGRIDDDLHAFH